MKITPENIPILISDEIAHSGQPSVDGDRKWYAVYVRSRWGKVVFAEFERRGIEASLPLLTKIRQWSDRKKEVKVPWFPGYVFVKIDLNTEKFVVLETPGVVKYVPTNSRVIAIPESELYWLQVLISENLALRHETSLPAGAPVQVMYGPLQGYRGRVVEQKSATRIVIWLDAIMQGVSVELDPCWLDSTKQPL